MDDRCSIRYAFNSSSEFIFYIGVSLFKSQLSKSKSKERYKIGVENSEHRNDYRYKKNNSYNIQNIEMQGSFIVFGLLKSYLRKKNQQTDVSPLFSYLLLRAFFSNVPIGSVIFYISNTFLRMVNMATIANMTWIAL